MVDEAHLSMLVAKDDMLKVPEGDHHRGDVVQCPPEHAVLENVVDTKTSELVDGRGVLVKFGNVHGGIPYKLNRLSI